MDLRTLFENPEWAKNLRLEVTPADLHAFGVSIFQQAAEESKKNIQNNIESYLTPTETASLLKVSKVTLWHCDRKEILEPHYIGKLKRYKKSDIEKLMADRKRNK